MYMFYFSHGGVRCSRNDKLRAGIADEQLSLSPRFAVIYIAWSLLHFWLEIGNDEGDRFIYASLDWSKPASTATLSMVIGLILIPLVNFMFWVFVNIGNESCGYCGQPHRASPALRADAGGERTPSVHSESREVLRRAVAGISGGESDAQTQRKDLRTDSQQEAEETTVGACSSASASEVSAGGARGAGEDEERQEGEQVFDLDVKTEA